MTRMRAVIVTFAVAVASIAGDQADRPLALMASSAIVGVRAGRGATRARARP